MKLLALVGAAAVTAALAIPLAADAATVLVGTASLRVLQKVEYRATVATKAVRVR